MARLLTQEFWADFIGARLPRNRNCKIQSRLIALRFDNQTRVIRHRFLELSLAFGGVTGARQIANGAF